MSISGPLKGIKVLDFSRLLPGPLTTHMLTRLGASVVKVEQLDSKGKSSDYVRYIPPMIKFEDCKPHGALFEALNGGKKSMVIDLKHKDGVDIVKKMISSFDVLVESNRPGVMKKLGVSYEDLREYNPGLVYCSISGYGASGPYATRAGHDVNYMAISGLLGLSGSCASLPPLPAFQAADASGAYQAVVGILAALLSRTSTQTGQFVDVSLTEAAMALAVPSLTEALHSERGIDRGTGILSGGLINYNVYATKDNKHISVGALEPHFWAKFCDAIHQPELKQCTERSQVEKVFADRTYEEWREVLSSLDECVEPVLCGQDIFTHPQHVARQSVLKNPAGPPQLVLTPKMSGHPTEVLPRASELAEDTQDILRNCGFSDDDIQKHINDKAIL